MKIKSLHIENWRSIKELDLMLSSLTEFVGKNNSGKSNILTAILFFFGETGKVTDQDYNDNSREIVVEVVFQYLDTHDQQQFKKYVTVDGEMTVRKTASIDGVTEYRGYSEQPVDERLREENLSEYTSREKAAALPFASDLPLGRLSVKTLQPLLDNYLQANRATLEFERRLEENQFMGVKTIAQGMLGEVLHIPPISSAIDELNTRGNTAFNKLYLKLADQVAASSPEYRDAQAAIGRLVKSLNRLREDGTLNTDRPEGLTKLEDIITESLQSWQTKLHVEFDLANAEDAIKLNTTVLVDDGIKTDVSRKGNGLQRSLIFALIKSWAKLLREERLLLERDAEASSLPKRGASNSHFFIFEEPELFLHPHAQRELFDSLKELASDNNQIFLTTHSSSFLKLEDYQSIVRVCKDNSTDGTTTVQCNEDLFTSFDEKRRFDLNQWLCPNRSEVFFASRVILVEGSTEEVIIPYLAKRLGVYKYDYSIVNCGSKGSIPTYIKLLNCFNINYVAVYDLDHQAHKQQQAWEFADAESGRINEMIDTAFGFSVAFENDIEEELCLSTSGSAGKPHKALQHVSDEGFVIPERLASKIRTIYTHRTANALALGATIVVHEALAEALVDAAVDSVAAEGEANFIPEPDTAARLANSTQTSEYATTPPAPTTPPLE